MKITPKLLQNAVEANILNTTQAEKLLEFLKENQANEPQFNATHVFYYFGGLLAIFAMSLFMTLGWESFGGMGIFILSCLYAVLGLGLASKFQGKGYRIPAGICATFVVVLTPLAIYGLQQALGFWPDNSTYREYHYYIQWHWIFMEAGTLIIGIILSWIYRYPFMIMPIAVTLWYMSMDIARMLIEYPSFEFQTYFSMMFGFMTILIAFWVDIRSRHAQDYAFWLYLFGVIAFWTGLIFQHSDSEWSRFLFLLINLGMIGIGVILVRRVFVIFGAMGTIQYVGYLSYSLFANSIIFPVVLTALGFLIIYIGTLWQKYESSITKRVHVLLPAALRELLESRMNYQ